MNALIDIAQYETPAPATTPGQQRQLTVVEYAIQAGAPVTEVRALVEAQIQMDNHKLAMLQAKAVMDREDRIEAARNAFNEDFARFKALEVVKITKDKHVSYQGAKGQTDYDHATIGNVVAVLTAAVSKYGFSHSWATSQAGNNVTVTCTLRHKQGHTESVALSADADSSGGKNAIQAIGSAITYLQRYTLLAITGCATSDQPDDDGATPALVALADDQVETLIEQVKCSPNLPHTMALWEANNAKLLPLPEQHARLKEAVAARRADFKALKRGAQ